MNSTDGIVGFMIIATIVAILGAVAVIGHGVAAVLIGGGMLTATGAVAFMTDRPQR